MYLFLVGERGLQGVKLYFHWWWRKKAKCPMDQMRHTALSWTWDILKGVCLRGLAAMAKCKILLEARAEETAGRDMSHTKKYGSGFGRVVCKEKAKAIVVDWLQSCLQFLILQVSNPFANSIAAVEKHWLSQPLNTAGLIICQENAV